MLVDRTEASLLEEFPSLCLPTEMNLKFIQRQLSAVHIAGFRKKMFVKSSTHWVLGFYLVLGFIGFFGFAYLNEQF